MTKGRGERIDKLKRQIYFIDDSLSLRIRYTFCLSRTDMAFPLKFYFPRSQRFFLLSRHDLLPAMIFNRSRSRNGVTPFPRFPLVRGERLARRRVFILFARADYRIRQRFRTADVNAARTDSTETRSDSPSSFYRPDPIANGVFRETRVSLSLDVFSPHVNLPGVVRGGTKRSVERWVKSQSIADITRT